MTFPDPLEPLAVPEEEEEEEEETLGVQVNPLTVPEQDWQVRVVMSKYDPTEHE